MHDRRQTDSQTARPTTYHDNICRSTRLALTNTLLLCRPVWDYLFYLFIFLLVC